MTALVFGGALMACFGEGPPAPPPPEPPETPVPIDPNPWPTGCEIEDAAVHPTRPWLAVACTNHGEERGAVLVFDTAAGTIHWVTELEGYVGWSDDEVLRWHPDGERLVTNVDTNGLALLVNGELIGRAHPDETRDHGVRVVWVGDRLYADTRALFEIQPGDRFEFDELDAPRIGNMGWNAAIQAVVGQNENRIVAYDPVRERVVYDAPLDAYGDRGQVSFSPDRRWAVREQSVSKAIPGERYLDVRDQLLFVNGDTGKVHGLRDPSSPVLHATRWGASGVLAVVSKVHESGGPGHGRRLEVFRDGERSWTSDLGEREIRRVSGPGGFTGMAWSPSGALLAVLLDRDEVRVLDRDSGAVRATFTAPGPDRAPLAWTDETHLVRVRDTFVAAWTLDGRKVAEWKPDPGGK
ncbi:MAG: hypothetical protein ABMB14_19090 [Myxococcota bacterium]